MTDMQHIQRLRTLKVAEFTRFVDDDTYTITVDLSEYKCTPSSGAESFLFFSIAKIIDFISSKNNNKSSTRFLIHYNTSLDLIEEAFARTVREVQESLFEA